ncbi:MAG: protein kinase [Myxococcales bacterium]|nr:protein kinase [Myxococcales bacterium]
MSEVYVADDLRARSQVAVKLLTRREEESRRRFVHEFRVLAEVEHENLVKAYHYGATPNGEPYYTLELLDGYSLNYWFDVHDRVAPARVVRIGVQVCRALEELHRHHVIHRDVKPSNIVLLEGSDERVKLIDLGIAKLKSGYYRAHQDATSTSRRLVTPAPCVPCTPSYAAPEVGVEPPHPRHDVYSLGVVLFRLLTGKMVKQCDLRRLDETFAELPAVLAEALEPAICEDPQNRYQSAGEFREALEEALGELSPASPLVAPRGREKRSTRGPANRLRWSRARVIALTAAITASLSAAIVWFALRGGGDTAKPVERAPATTPPQPEQAKAERAPPPRSTPRTTSATAPARAPQTPTGASAPANDTPTDRTSDLSGKPRSSAMRRPPRGHKKALRAIEMRLHACLGLTDVTSVVFTVRVRRGHTRLYPNVELPRFAQACVDRAAAELDFGDASFTTRYKIGTR